MRRSTPERLEAAKGAATLERLVSAGMLRERADTELRTWETVHGGRRDWEAAYQAIRSRLRDG